MKKHKCLSINVFLVVLCAVPFFLLSACAYSEQKMPNSSVVNGSTQGNLSETEDNQLKIRYTDNSLLETESEEILVYLNNAYEQIEMESMDSLLQKTMTFKAPLSEAEAEDVLLQSQILQEFDIKEDISEESLAKIAEYYVRCQRFENTTNVPAILTARHEFRSLIVGDSTNPWEYWVLTSESGNEYWLMGFTNRVFDVKFIFRGGPDGELLYGLKK